MAGVQAIAPTMGLATGTWTPSTSPTRMAFINAAVLAIF